MEQLRMSAFPAVIVKARKARPFFGRHPWLFVGAIDKIQGEAAPGGQVRVLSFEREFIAYGLYNPDSNIRVRLYSWDPERPFDESLLEERIERAVRSRHELLGLADPKGACRLVFSEADGLSGLVVDRYADVLVVQFTSRALAQFEGRVLAVLMRLLTPRGIYRRTERGVGELENLDLEDELVAGSIPEGPFPIVENGMQWLVEPRTGQKTGLFLDQRDNRQSLCRYSKGRAVLDVCCYGGGFGITAMRNGGAASFLGVDSSGPAIHLAQQNAELNGVSGEFLHEQAVPAMQQLLREGRRFGLVVCDPPKYARSSGAIEQASKGYDQLNRLALDLLEPGGVLCTCSCSGHISPAMFLQILAGAAQKAGRSLQVLEQRGQAADHPVSVYCLESAYLKCIIARCDD
jgi:23S rRNA (cytosine1962-C5)-methyltransferase